MLNIYMISPIKSGSTKGVVRAVNSEVAFDLYLDKVKGADPEVDNYTITEILACDQDVCILQ